MSSEIPPVEFETSPADYVRRLKSGQRRSFAKFYRTLLAISVLFFILVWWPTIFPVSYEAVLNRISNSLAISCEAAANLLALSQLAAYLVALVLPLRWLKASQAARFGQSLRWQVSSTAEGLYFVRPDIEHLLKWPGIYEVLRHRDGLTIVHGLSCYFVPFTAFTSPDQRHAFIANLAANLSPDVRARSSGVSP